MKKILVIVPAFNEEKNLKNVILDIKKNLAKIDILVINDGSSDNTGQVAQKARVGVLNLPLNLGIGGAVQTGLIYANENNYQIVLRIDGDGQHRAADLKRILIKLIKSSADIVIGSRFIKKTDYQIPLPRRIGIFYFSNLIKILTGKKISDPTSGLQGMTQKVVQLLAKNYPQDYPEPEQILQLNLAGFKISEIPVEMQERVEGKSSISWRKSIYYMIKVTLAIFISLIRQISRKV